MDCYTFGTCENASGSSISCPTLGAGVGVSEVLTSVNIGVGNDGGATLIANWYSPDSNVAFSTASKYEGQVRWRSTSPMVTVPPTMQIMAGMPAQPKAGCAPTTATPCTIANEVADCGGSNTCLVAPQSGPWHPVVGAFEISFYAQAVNTSTGTPRVAVATSRTGSSWSASNTFALTNDGNWHQYALPFTGGDVAFSGGQNQRRLDFKMTASNGSAETGATIYIDDVYYGRAATSTTGFRNEVITSLQSIESRLVTLWSLQPAGNE